MLAHLAEISAKLSDAFTELQASNRNRGQACDFAILRCYLRDPSTIQTVATVKESQIVSLAPVSSLDASIKADGSIAATNENGIAMAFTGIRHFKHWLDDVLSQC